MSKKICDLLNDTFDNGTIHIKYLEEIIRAIVGKLNLNEEKIDDSVKCSHKKLSDPVSNLISSATNPCENSMLEILDLLNITKRIEALEISIQKISSVIQTILTNRPEKEASDIQNIQEIEINHFNMSESDDKSEDIQTIKSLTTPNDPQEITQVFAKKISMLEERLDVITLSMNQNHQLMRNQICKIEENMKGYGEKFKDLFFACEQNDEKIDEFILSFDDFKSNMCCLKSDVKKLLEDSENNEEKFVQITMECENLKHLKADQSYVEDFLFNGLEKISSELEHLIKLVEILVVENANIKIGMMKLDKVFCKFKNDIIQAFHFLYSKIDEKLEKKALKDFKITMKNQFDEFLKELKIIILENSRKSTGLGGIELLSSLKCISCENNIFMKTELDHNVMPSKVRKPKTFSSVKKNYTKKSHSLTPKDLLVKFPPPTQQCFIISRDNAIFKADPLTCLLNSNYEKVFNQSNRSNEK